MGVFERLQGLLRSNSGLDDLLDFSNISESLFKLVFGPNATPGVAFKEIWDDIPEGARYVAMPLNSNTKGATGHWVMAFLDIMTNTIYYYDSLNIASLFTVWEGVFRYIDNGGAWLRVINEKRGDRAF